MHKINIIMRNGKEHNLDAVMHSVGPGWHKLVRRLVEDLYALGWDGHLFQMKEKFGGLRFYIGQASPAIYERISQAEAESYKTCEECGAEGSGSTINGWISTRCETHKMRT